MIATRCLCVFTTLLVTSASSLAKGGGMHSEDRYNPQHIESLPPEICNAIYHKCSTPKALQDFASFPKIRSCYISSISIAINETRFATLLVACIRSMVPKAAFIGS